MRWSPSTAPLLALMAVMTAVPGASARPAANGPQPTVTLQRVGYPPGDTGRFDLRVAGRTVAPAALDGAITAPVPIDPGEVVVSQRAAAGTTARRYRSAVVCSSGRGRVRAAAGWRLRAPVGAGGRLACVMVNLRRRAPDPGAPSLAVGADGQVDLAVRVLPVRRRVTAGSVAGFRVRVRNRGSVEASGVRMTLATRQEGLRARSLTVSTPQRAGKCMASEGIAFCYATRLTPGGLLVLHARVSSRMSLAAVRLNVVADADQDERRVRNNSAVGRVLMRRPPPGPCGRSARTAPVARAAC